ncbi:MAG: hypothetical protein WA952_00215 [Lewinella sp.]
MKNKNNKLAAVLLLLLTSGFVLAANRYWVHKPFYENNFSTAAELAEWNIVEDNGTGSWQLNGDGTATLTMDDDPGDYACRLFNREGGAPRFLPLDALYGRLEIMVSAITGGDQRFWVQAEYFTADNQKIDQIDLLSPQHATGFFSINLSDYTWPPQTDKLRFILVGANYSKLQGSITFDYFSYSNDSGVWSNSANWSSSPGGVAGASVPGPSDIAIFDGAANSDGSCLLVADQSVGGIDIASTYAGNLDLQGFALTVGSSGLSIAGGGITGNGADIEVGGDVTISGGTFSNAGGRYAVTGHVTLTGGLLDFDSDEVLFTGSGDQIFSAPVSTSVQQLTVDKPAGEMILQADIVVAADLTLTQGIIRTDGHKLQLGISDASPGELFLGSGRIDGTFHRWLSGTEARNLQYPLGNANALAPLTLEVGSLPDNGGTASVTYQDAATPAFDAVDFSDGEVSISERSAANWVMDLDGLTGGTYTLEAANDHLGPIDDLNRLRFTQAARAVGTHVPTVGTVANPVLRRSGLSSVEMAGSWYASLQSAALPLVWGTVKATVQGEGVVLDWSTLAEIHTSHFVVEHAMERGLFNPLGRVEAVGDPDDMAVYRYEHLSASAGVHYYRLQQVDLDGAVSYSSVVTAAMDGKAAPILANVVNPIGQEIRFTVPDRLIHIQISGSNGQVIKTAKLQPGVYRWDCSSWTPGVYQIATVVEGRPGPVRRVVKF